MARHITVRCSVRGCHFDADRWFDARLLFGRGYREQTFYLCDPHAQIVAPDDEAVHWLDPESGYVRSVELAVYACADDCEECNP